MPFQLSVQGQQTPARVVPLRPGSNLVGRSPRADIVLQAPLVSRTHAKIIVEGAGANLFDLDSHNGTFVNGEKVRSRAINAGDSVYIGGFRLTLEASNAPVSADGGPLTVESMRLLEKAVATLSAARRGEATVTRDAAGLNLSLLARTAEMARRHVPAAEHLEHLLRLTKEALRAPIASLLTQNPDGLGLRMVAGDPTGEPPIAWPLARRSIAESTAYFSRERPADIELADAANLPGPSALLCIPLIAEPGAAPVGVVQVVRLFEQGGFSDAEVESALLLSHIMATRLVPSDIPEEVTETSNATLEALAQQGGGLRTEDLRAVLMKAVPEELADRVLAAAASGGGGIQPAVNAGHHVVLFYDLHGFDAWAIQQPAEEVVRVVGLLSSAAASVAGSFGGRLDQPMGAGGFLRFWDGSLGEAAEAALRASLDLRARVATALQDTARVLKLRVGVDAGPVLAGVFGDGARATYTVVGTPARVAERIAEMAGQGELYITAAVRNALGNAPGWRLIALGPHALRGRGEAVDLFRVDGAPVGSA